MDAEVGDTACRLESRNGAETAPEALRAHISHSEREPPYSPDRRSRFPNSVHAKLHVGVFRVV